MKEVPSEIIDVEGARSPRSPLKGSPEEGPKTDPEKDKNKSPFGGSVLAPLGVSWATFGAVWGHLVTGLPPLGPRGSKGEAQEQPESSPR